VRLSEEPEKGFPEIDKEGKVVYIGLAPVMVPTIKANWSTEAWYTPSETENQPGFITQNSTHAPANTCKRRNSTGLAIAVRHQVNKWRTYQSSRPYLPRWKIGGCR